MNGLLLSRLRNSRGFAIPTAIFVIIVVSMLALGGLYIAQNDATASTGIRRSWKAFNAANAGATHVLAKWDRFTYGRMNPGEEYDTGWRQLPDGSDYTASVRRVDDGSNVKQMLYRIRTVGRPGPGVTAQRLVVTMARADRAEGLCCDGAMKTQGLLNIRGTGAGVKVSGVDAVPTGWAGRCPVGLQDVPGIRVLEDANIDITGQPDLDGAPAILEDPSITEQDFVQFGDVSYEDLAAAADKQYPSGLVLDELYPSTDGGKCLTSAATNWGDPLVPGSPCWDYLPIIHIDGDLKVAGNGYGQGVLLVDGNMQVTGTFEFYGVVIVMGEADFRGSTDLFGGLLVRNGISADSESYLRGGTQLQYSSCSAGRAMLQATVARPLSGRHWFEVLE